MARPNLKGELLPATPAPTPSAVRRQRGPQKVPTGPRVAPPARPPSLPALPLPPLISSGLCRGPRLLVSLPQAPADPLNWPWQAIIKKKASGHSRSVGAAGINAGKAGRGDV